jgi:hypothetical protein
MRLEHGLWCGVPQRATRKLSIPMPVTAPELPRIAGGCTGCARAFALKLASEPASAPRVIVLTVSIDPPVRARLSGLR